MGAVSPSILHSDLRRDAQLGKLSVVVSLQSKAQARHVAKRLTIGSSDRGASASMSLRRGSMIWINQLRWSASQPASLKRDR